MESFKYENCSHKLVCIGGKSKETDIIYNSPFVGNITFVPAYYKCSKCDKEGYENDFYNKDINSYSPPKNSVKKHDAELNIYADENVNMYLCILQSRELYNFLAILAALIFFIWKMKDFTEDTLEYFG